jgi:hypothetical protein
VADGRPGDAVTASVAPGAAAAAAAAAPTSEAPNVFVAFFRGLLPLQDYIVRSEQGTAYRD